MIKILFVCHGNICRSPMAEFIMKDLVKKANLEQSIQIESAATSAEEIGNPKVSNMVMLGAYVAATGLLKPETIEAMIQAMFTGPKAKLVPLNIEAFRRGMKAIA